MSNSNKSSKRGTMLFSYVVKYDTGFAPNPEGRYCTLACCKPRIRNKAEEGDWIVGTCPVKLGSTKVCFAMQVSRKMEFNDYFKDEHFRNRRDNIYYLRNGQYQQKENRYHDHEQKEHDLRSKYVLLSTKFCYFGNDQGAPELPPNLDQEIPKRGPGHRSRFSQETIDSFLSWLNKQGNPGRHGVLRDTSLHCQQGIESNRCRS